MQAFPSFSCIQSLILHPYLSDTAQSIYRRPDLYEEIQAEELLLEKKTIKGEKAVKSDCIRAKDNYYSGAVSV
jgi:hypothetical protein